MISLVGYTGFVGSNLAKQTEFGGLYNSKNIADAYDTKPDLLVYAGVRAEKFLANKDPETDRAIIDQAIFNINKISPKMLVLISTVDIYENPIGVNEDTIIQIKGLQPYGYNRYVLEKWIEQNFQNYLIIRLPGLYGRNIKKNFIFDIMNVIPSMLNEKNFTELMFKNNFLEQFYIKQSNGLYKIKEMTCNEKNVLKAYFYEVGFSAINFTDSNASYQFYNLAFLWKHIRTALNLGIKKLNLATEPVTASQLYQYIKGSAFVNEISTDPAQYDFKTKYFDLFGGKNGYIFESKFVLNDIKNFVEVYDK